MKLHKVKRPGGVFVFDVERIVEDDFGTWVGALCGARWAAPHATGLLDVDVVLLINPANYWVGWWVDDPADRRVEIDICLPPERVDDGWTYVDLELDPVRHEAGVIEVEDHDEFLRACREGWISPSEQVIAETTSSKMELALIEGREPLGTEGWRKFHRLR